MPKGSLQVRIKVDQTMFLPTPSVWAQAMFEVMYLCHGHKQQTAGLQSMTSAAAVDFANELPLSLLTP